MLEKVTMAFVEVALGPTGGLFMLGLALGVFISMKWVAPRFYGPKIDDLTKRVAALEEKLQPYEAFAHERAMQAMGATNANR